MDFFIYFCVILVVNLEVMAFVWYPEVTWDDDRYQLPSHICTYM